MNYFYDQAAGSQSGHRKICGHVLPACKVLSVRWSRDGRSPHTAVILKLVYTPTAAEVPHIHLTLLCTHIQWTSHEWQEVDLDVTHTFQVIRLTWLGEDFAAIRVESNTADVTVYLHTANNLLRLCTHTVTQSHFRLSDDNYWHLLLWRMFQSLQTSNSDKPFYLIYFINNLVSWNHVAYCLISFVWILWVNIVFIGSEGFSLQST